MNRYVMKFYKDGYVKYTSHLDLLRIFGIYRKLGIHQNRAADGDLPEGRGGEGSAAAEHQNGGKNAEKPFHFRISFFKRAY